MEAKIFKSGNSQAIRLPRECRFTSATVRMNRIGNALVIVPENDNWLSFQEGIAEAVDFPVRAEPKGKLRNVRLK